MYVIYDNRDNICERLVNKILILVGRLLLLLLLFAIYFLLT